MNYIKPVSELKFKQKIDKKIQRLEEINLKRYQVSDEEQYLIDNIDKFMVTDLRLIYETIYVWIDYENKIVWVIEDHSANGIYCGQQPAPLFNSWIFKKVTFSECKDMNERTYGRCNPFQYLGQTYCKPLALLTKLNQTHLSRLSTKEWNDFKNLVKPHKETSKPKVKNWWYWQ